MKQQSNSLQPHTPLAHGLSYALDVACFVFFALSLCIPSGYSYGSTAIALLALTGCALARPTTRMSRDTAYLLGILLIMGLLWSMSLDRWFSPAGWGYGVKYALAAASLWYLSKTGVRMSAVVWGIGFGAAGALAIAAYQAGVLKMPRVNGFTNAIQFGGIAMYLGFATWVLALFGRWNKFQTTALGIFGACAIYASFLSDSRGSWVVVPMLIAAVWCMAWLNGFKRLATVSAALMVVIALAVAMPAYKKLEQRGSEAVSEVSQYLKEPQKYAETSVGQRLEQWRLALHLIEQRPLSGWGLSGYAQAKQEMVDQHLAHPSVMEYGHAHNEILDMWVKRGILGLLVLLLFYAIPLCVFWPTSRRLALVCEEIKPKLFALRAAAVLLPLSYFGFGWTQVFFAHNSGNMFYIFSLAALWGAICRLSTQSPTSAHLVHSQP